MRCLDLVVEEFGARLTVDEEEHRLRSTSTRLHANDTELAAGGECQGRMTCGRKVGRIEPQAQVALKSSLSARGPLTRLGERAVTMASRRAAKVGPECCTVARFSLQHRAAVMWAYNCRTTCGGKVSLLVLACDCRESCKSGCLTNRLVLVRAGAVFDVTGRMPRVGGLRAGQELVDEQRRWVDGGGSPVDTKTRRGVHR